MKKLTDIKLAQLVGVKHPTIAFWKKNKPRQYEAVRGYFFLKENNFFKNFKKIKALAELIRQECDSKYAEDLVKLIEEGDEIVEGISNSKRREV